MSLCISIHVPWRSAWRRAAPCLAALWLAACGALPVQRAPSAAGGECEALYARYEAALDASGVRDAQSARIAQFPYARVDRLLTSLRDEVDAPERFDAWFERLLRAGRQARAAELMNLAPDYIGATHPAAGPTHTELAQRLNDCAQELKQRDLHDRARRAHLREQARVPDDYSVARRTLGLYPLAALPFARGVRGMHAQMRALYANGEALLAGAEITHYVPPRAAAAISDSHIGALLARARNNPLAIPELDPGDAQQLFAHHAPILSVRTLSEADALGAPGWDRNGALRVDTQQPRVYQLLSHTRFGADILLQLNYVFWFPARPKSGRFDLLGGALDGLIWRVTLDRDGVPLIYDTIHNCGCYHQFFPSAQLRAREQRGFEEPILVPQAAPQLKPGERVQLGIDANTHYLFSVRAAASTPATAITYALDNYDKLRSLPRADGSRRSLFGPTGMVAGSERGERFLFWPMGIESAGAMRQWGRHATAFVGRRHFDEARLIERYFEPVR